MLSPPPPAFYGSDWSQSTNPRHNYSQAAHKLNGGASGGRQLKNFAPKPIKEEPFFILLQTLPRSSTEQPCFGARSFSLKMKPPVNQCFLLAVGLSLFLPWPSCARRIPQRCRRLLSNPEYASSLVDRLNEMVADRDGAMGAYNNLATVQQYTPMPLTAFYSKYTSNKVRALRCGMSLKADNDPVNTSRAAQSCMEQQRRGTREERWLKIYDEETARASGQALCRVITMPASFLRCCAKRRARRTWC